MPCAGGRAVLPVATGATPASRTWLAATSWSMAGRERAATSRLTANFGIIWNHKEGVTDERQEHALGERSRGPRRRRRADGRVRGCRRCPIGEREGVQHVRQHAARLQWL